MKHVCLILLLFCMLVENTLARRSFYVAKEVSCRENEICYTIEDNMPLTGKIRYYHANGQVLSDNDYRNGLRHGVRVTYDEDGNQKSYLLYQQGKLNGMGVSYYANGNVEFETEFVDGVIHGTNRQYYEDGRLKREEARYNGELSGRVREFYEDGKLSLEAYYDEGNLYLIKCRERNGRTIDFTADKELYVASGKTPCNKN